MLMLVSASVVLPLGDVLKQFRVYVAVTRCSSWELWGLCGKCHGPRLVLGVL